MIPAIKKTAIRLLTLPPLFGLMNRALNTAPIIVTLHRQTRPEFGILGHDKQTIKEYLSFLLRHGYRTITVDVIDAWLRGEDDRDMTNTVAFTFDDGYRDQAGLIRDVFLPMGVPASMFLITDFIDGRDWPWDSKIRWLIFNAPKKWISLTVDNDVLKLDLTGNERERYKASKILRNRIKYTVPQEMHRAINELAAAVGIPLPALPPNCHRPITWDDVRELETHGIRFGSHSVSHYIFSSLDDAEAIYQLNTSRQRINAELKYPLSVFCYPIGERLDYTGRELMALPNAGYTSAVTMNPGVVKRHAADEEYERYAVNRYSCPDTADSFIQDVSWIERLNELGRKCSPSYYISTLYGTPRGFLKALGSNINYRLGKYRCYEQIEWARVKRLVFICQGNVCRSPFAEAVARNLGLPAVSYGLTTDQGAMVNPIATRVALQYGVDMARHRSLKLDVNNLKEGDLVVGMVPGHCNQLRDLNVPGKIQFTLIGLWADARRTAYLHDPYGLTDEYYAACLKKIQRAVTGMGKRLVHEGAHTIKHSK